MLPEHAPRHGQQGFSLLEGLIAILIFSFGILAIIGLQATATKAVTDARNRMEASYLANKLISQMWINFDRSLSVPALRANVQQGGSVYTDWVAEVQSSLPGAQANPPVLTVNTVAGTDNTVAVALQVFWQMPGEATVHNYTVNTQIR